MNLTDLLQFLATARKSGTLKFDQGKITKQIYFKNGMIVGSKSNDPREYLGQVLLHYGKVDEIQLKVAREMQRAPPLDSRALQCRALRVAAKLG